MATISQVLEQDQRKLVNILESISHLQYFFISSWLVVIAVIARILLNFGFIYLFQIHDYSSMTPMDDKGDLEDCTDPATEKMRQIIDDVLLAQQTALEIFTNICCDETSGEWEDTESVSSCEIWIGIQRKSDMMGGVVKVEI